MLAAGTLEDVDSIYSSSGEDRKIQVHKVNYYLKLLGERYSSQLHSIVMEFLASNPLKRRKCSETYASLYEFEDKILDLQTFWQAQNVVIP